ncbi:hypothetical protein [Pontibacillus sp. HN14]|uniref:hypothetical protein n=1 Tax=Pontibacillus sp. HN14 TaxID=2898421 RepID=UPI001E531167|nr:hypothetical protein [Pontibacillus sp. HN14]MCD5323240.1 hypothetical protein [Pontibacillus sp. HN14]
MEKTGERLLLLIYASLIVIPMLTVLFSTFKTTSEMYENPIGFPSAFDVSNHSKRIV